MTIDGFLLLDAVTEVTNGSAFAVARFEDFLFDYTLGAAIDSGQIDVAVQYRAPDGTWKTFYSWSLTSAGSDLGMPIAHPNVPLGTIRAVLTAHNAIDTNTDPVAITVMAQCGR